MTVLHAHHRPEMRGVVRRGLVVGAHDGAVATEDVVERDAELGDDPVQSAHRRLRLARLDLRDHARGEPDAPGQLALADANPVSLFPEPRSDVFQFAGQVSTSTPFVARRVALSVTENYPG